MQLPDRLPGGSDTYLTMLALRCELKAESWRGDSIPEFELIARLGAERADRFVSALLAQNPPMCSIQDGEFRFTEFGWAMAETMPGGTEWRAE